jgi:23S rRNA (cytosine1962-C5)-methyltransferase
MSQTLDDLLNALPEPAQKRITLRVTAAAEGTLRRGHPWLYDQAIRSQSTEGQPGDLGVVFDREHKFVAIGLYDPTSPLRLRVLQHRKPALIDAEWFAQRIKEAVARRAALKRSTTTAYRLVHGENDGLPGLIVDRYDTTLVIKLYSAGWIPHLRAVLPAITGAVRARRLVLRLARSVEERPKHLYGLTDGMILMGSPLDGPLVFEENGLHFEVDVRLGQKTGFFLDHRENRARVERLTRRADVLDAFAYTGAFSVYAARGGAASVLSIDSSRPALAVAERNMARNREYPSVANCRHETQLGDAFDILKRLAAKRRRFDVVIVDPPAFAKSQREIPAALVAYRQLTTTALQLLSPRGVLVIASCSSHITTKTFYETLHLAASRAGRSLQEMERTTHPVDHPIGFAEGAYLNCLFTRAA